MPHNLLAINNLNNYIMKLREAKKNELDVLEKLNANEKNAFKLHKDHYSRYDIGGTLDDTFCIVEVKKRLSEYATWYIEVEKLAGMFTQSKAEGFDWKTGKKYLCNSINGVHYFYNIDDIVKYPKIKRYMNATTAQGFRNQGQKVEKEVFEFPSNIYEFKL